MKKFKGKLLLAATLSTALLLGGTAASANAVPNSPSLAAVGAHSQTIPMAGPMIRPAAPGECWAQAGRVIGGFWGGMIATAANPILAAFYWMQYLGNMSKEEKDKYGNFAC